MRSISFLVFFCAYLAVKAQDYKLDADPWMKTDLSVNTFKNGDPIFHAQSDEDWEKASSEGLPAYCYFLGDIKKGVLYNWFAVNDDRGLAPDGYRIPTKSDFEALSSSGKELKSQNGGWLEYVENNSSFNALSVGYRTYDGGSFLSRGYLTFYWSKDKGKTHHAYRMGLFDGQSKAVIDEGRREDGYSVRCIRDFKVSVIGHRVAASAEKIRPGESVDLSIVGGALGEGAEFYWFKSECGTQQSYSFAKGREIKVNPSIETEYYVTILNGNRKFNCLSITIDVRDETVLPVAIIGNSNICRGESVLFSLEGGELCSSCDWYWYTDLENDAKYFATGGNLSVKPENTTVYYLRSVSANGEMSDFIQKTITVYTPPNPPNSIKLETSGSICAGQFVSLTVEGDLVPGSKWVWEYNGVKKDAGDVYTEILYLSGTFQVYGQSEVCGRSASVSKEIRVYSYSQNPISINKQFKNSRKFTLQPNGGALGDGAYWQWYKMKKGDYREIETGNQVIVSSWKRGTYMVKAEGGKCPSPNSSKGTSIIIEGLSRNENRNWNTNYSETSGNVHFGFDLGANYMIGAEKMIEFDTLGYFNRHGYEGRFNLHFHPIMKKRFSFGLRGGVGYGFYTLPTNNPLYEFQRDNYNVNNYSYHGLIGNFGAELLIGLQKDGKINLLLDYSHQLTQNQINFSSPTSTPINYYFNSKIESFGLGFRFGSYSHRYSSKGKQFDLMFTFNALSNQSLFEFAPMNYGAVIARNAGLQMRLWLHGAIKIQAGMIFQYAVNKFPQAVNLNGSVINAGILYSFDKFH